MNNSICPINQEECLGDTCMWYINNELFTGCAVTLLAKSVFHIEDEGIEIYSKSEPINISLKKDE